jgi:hypothetical protein
MSNEEKDEVIFTHVDEEIDDDEDENPLHDPILNYISGSIHHLNNAVREIQLSIQQLKNDVALLKSKVDITT